MKKEFVSYEIALALKELGFDELCSKGYTEEYKTLINFSNTYTNTSVKNTLPTKPFVAPLYQQAFRWFREKYGLVVYIQYYAKWDFYISRIDDKIAEVQDVDYDCSFKGGTYEEAELECLKKLIEIVKTQKE
jgi:hypothetical protein